MDSEKRNSGLLHSANWQQVTAAEPEAAAAHDPLDLPEGSVGYSSAKPQLSSIALMLLGIFGGVYLLYTIGWYWVVVLYSQLHMLSAQTGGVVWLWLQTALFGAALFAPAVWFILAVTLFKRNSWYLAISLLLGAVILLPLPLFVTGGN